MGGEQREVTLTDIQDTHSSKEERSGRGLGRVGIPVT